MKYLKRAFALLMAVVLAAGLAGCSTIRSLLGKTDESQPPEEMQETVVKYIEGRPGGSISLEGVEGLNENAHVSCVVQEGKMYVSIKNIMNGNTFYFQPGSDTITVTAYATCDSGRTPEFKLSLWMLNDDARAQYVEGNTMQLNADGGCYTCTMSGLDTSRHYKLTVGYVSMSYYLTGAITVSPIGSDELVETDNGEEDDAA